MVYFHLSNIQEPIGAEKATSPMTMKTWGIMRIWMVVVERMINVQGILFKISESIYLKIMGS